MTPLFLDHCPQKNPMRENRCSYPRVFLLSNIRVQFGCWNWPTQQRISYTSQFERNLLNLLAKASENPSDSSSAQNCSCKPSVCPIWIASAPLYLMRALHQPFFVCVSPKRPCVSSGSLCVRCAGPSGALRSTWLPLREPLLALRHPPWLLHCSPDTISAFSISLYSMPFSYSLDHWFYLS